MKCILVCDNGHLEEVASIARRYITGIEFGAFYKPKLLENPKQAISEHNSCNDIVPKLCIANLVTFVQEVLIL